MNAFCFTKNGETWPNESVREGDTSETREVVNIVSIILDESLSPTQQVLSLFKAVSHQSIIENVNSAGLIFQSKEIKVAVFN